MSELLSWADWANRYGGDSRKRPKHQSESDWMEAVRERYFNYIRRIAKNNNDPRQTEALEDLAARKVAL